MHIRQLSAMAAVSVFAMGLLSGTAHADMTSCKANYTTSGNIFTGRTAKTSDDFPKVPPAVAYKRIYVSLMTNGWRITQSDKDAGAISALNVSGAVPFNILIEPEGSGSKVNATLNLGRQVGLSDVVIEVCMPIVAAGESAPQ